MWLSRTSAVIPPLPEIIHPRLLRQRALSMMWSGPTFLFWLTLISAPPLSLFSFIIQNLQIPSIFNSRIHFSGILKTELLSDHQGIQLASELFTRHGLEQSVSSDSSLAPFGESKRTTSASPPSSFFRSRQSSRTFSSSSSSSLPPPPHPPNYGESSRTFSPSSSSITPFLILILLTR